MVVSPFDASLLYQLNLREASEVNINTFCVDNFSLFYSDHLIDKLNLSLRQIAFILKHEARHIFYNHPARRDFVESYANKAFADANIKINNSILNKIHNLWSFATDYAINSVIRTEHTEDLDVPDIICLPEQKDFQPEKSAEHYYCLMLKDLISNLESAIQEAKNKPNVSNDESSNESGKSDDSSDSSCDDGDDASSDADEDDNENYDDTGEGDNDDSSELNNDVSEEDDSPSIAPVPMPDTAASDDMLLIEEVIQDFLDDMPNKEDKIDSTILTEETVEDLIKNQTNIDLAKDIAESGGAGELPATISKALETAKALPVNWREELFNLFNLKAKGKPSYKRPSRRQSSDLILPSKKIRTLDNVAIAFDLSSSVGDSAVGLFFDHVASLLRQFDVKTIHLIQFISQVVFSEPVTPAVLNEMANTRSYCGGTRFFPIIEEIKSKNINSVIVFTDCKSYDLGRTCDLCKDDGINLYWCVPMNIKLTEWLNTAWRTPTFGQIIPIEE